jgi:hypothetical protein
VDDSEPGFDVEDDEFLAPGPVSKKKRSASEKCSALQNCPVTEELEILKGDGIVIPLKEAGEIQKPCLKVLEESNKVLQVLLGVHHRPKALCTPNVQPFQKLSELYLRLSQPVPQVLSG